MTTRNSLPRRLATVAVALGLLLTGCTQGGEVKDPTPVSGATFSSLRIGISFDQPGLGVAKEAGTSDGVTTGTDASGFDVDTATYIAKSLGVAADTITWVKADPVDREKLLTEGKVDMVLSTYTINDERAAKVDFAGPYFVAHQDLLIRRNDEELTGVERLEGRTLCAAANTTSAQNVLARYQGNIALVQPNTFSECVQQLVKGTVDAVTTDDIILAGFAAEPQYKGVLKVVGKGFSDEPYGIGLPKGSTLVPTINQILTNYIADGSWQASLENTVGPSGYKIPSPPTPGK
ncbi:glutamate ABC transporter substrate-binding protein [Micropruina sonneratiae]|uniref:glutamate ABC transporter substrate-binding protein n=1 Tax=Micropruina sonneratiae TaxID=2986940 RepID=UPI0022265BD4|nr:glutamate ABC transporter substrate-binding protein [Micropruina sp. KQZ13P-5]MCW3156924.1 glutamate ABC transporter substrate-binding protein [Micropruina sp. KQZ13P-5]